jgi:hypothetical protein
MLVIQPPVIFSIFTQHLIRIFALEVLATRFDLIGAPPSPSCRSCLAAIDTVATQPKSIPRS